MSARIIKVLGVLIAVGSLIAVAIIQADYPPFENDDLGFRLYVAMTPLTVAVLGVLIYAVGEMVEALRARTADSS